MPDIKPYYQKTNLKEVLMPELIDELKKDHLFIAESLSNVKKFGVASKEGQKTLLSVKNDLLAHLKKEDEQLYPVLNNAAESNAILKRRLDTFAKDMDEISKSILEFFDKYSTGGSGIEFGRDFGRIFAALSDRLRKEELILYQEYEKLKQ